VGREVKLGVLIEMSIINLEDYMIKALTKSRGKVNDDEE